MPETKATHTPQEILALFNEKWVPKICNEMCSKAGAGHIAVLDDATIELIEAAERAAERYVNGEHGEQLTFDDAGEDDEDEGEEPVEEEKPRRKRGRQLEAVEA